MEDNEYEDLFVCSICFGDFNDPIMLDCSHVYCQKCINPFLKKENSKCPLCQKVINKEGIRKDALIIIIMKLYNLLNNCTDVFINFPLNFKYCQECEVFITNYSYKKHKNEKHNLLTFDKVLQLYFEGKKKFDKNMFMVLYFYLNPFLHEIKYLKDDKNSNIFYLGNNEYIFYKKMVNHQENKFLMDLMKDEINEIGCIKWFKGTLIHRKNWLFIHGYFLIKIIEGQLHILPKIFGFLNYKKIKFFGLIKLNKKSINKTDSLKIKDFIFHCGLLYDNDYYFGEFNEINISNLLIIENNGLNNLKEGEILYVKKEGIELKIIKSKKEKEKKIQKIENKLKYLNNLCIFFEYKDITLQIEIKPFYIQKDKNGNNQLFEEYELINCKINFINYKRTLIFDKIENSIYIFKNEEENKSLDIFKTKVIYINLKEDKLLFSQMKKLLIKNINNENIEDKRNFCNNLKKILETKVIDCNTNYYISEIKNGEINKNENNYYEISGCDVFQKIKGKNLKDKHIHFKDNFLIQMETIEDFFKYELNSDKYNFKDKKEEDKIACNACDII